MRYLSAESAMQSYYSRDAEALRRIVELMEEVILVACYNSGADDPPESRRKSMATVVTGTVNCTSPVTVTRVKPNLSYAQKVIAPSSGAFMFSLFQGDKLIVCSDGEFSVTGSMLSATAIRAQLENKNDGSMRGLPQIAQTPPGSYSFSVGTDHRLVIEELH